jgi:hypothetical protein
MSLRNGFRLMDSLSLCAFHLEMFSFPFTDEGLMNKENLGNGYIDRRTMP